MNTQILKIGLNAADHRPVGSRFKLNDQWFKVVRRVDPVSIEIAPMTLSDRVKFLFVRSKTHA